MTVAKLEDKEREQKKKVMQQAKKIIFKDIFKLKMIKLNSLIESSRTK
jgi:hypothetical protein